MKTVRFSNVVQKAGRPEAYLILVEPSKDRILQAAIKANRVMTVQQSAVGTKTDRGEIGFHSGPSREFLVFPKSLRTFRDRVVVGIKYDLLESEKPSPGGTSTTPRSPRKAPRKGPKEKPAAKVLLHRKTRVAKPVRRAGSKVIPFQAAPAAAPREEGAELKKQVRRAMKALEEGKAVAAFHLLQRIVGD